MAKTLQFRRGTTAELASVTGAEAELFVDITKDTVVVMDGATPGGKALATEEFVLANAGTGGSVGGDAVFDSALIGNVSIISNEVTGIDSYGNNAVLNISGETVNISPVVVSATTTTTDYVNGNGISIDNMFHSGFAPKQFDIYLYDSTSAILESLQAGDVLIAQYDTGGGLINNYTLTLETPFTYISSGHYSATVVEQNTSGTDKYMTNPYPFPILSITQNTSSTDAASYAFSANGTLGVNQDFNVGVYSTSTVTTPVTIDMMASSLTWSFDSMSGKSYFGFIGSSDSQYAPYFKAGMTVNCFVDNQPGKGNAFTLTLKTDMVYNPYIGAGSYVAETVEVKANDGMSTYIYKSDISTTVSSGITKNYTFDATGTFTTASVLATDALIGDVSIVGNTIAGVDSYGLADTLIIDGALQVTNVASSTTNYTYGSQWDGSIQWISGVLDWNGPSVGMSLMTSLKAGDTMTFEDQMSGGTFVTVTLTSAFAYDMGAMSYRATVAEFNSGMNIGAANSTISIASSVTKTSTFNDTGLTIDGNLEVTGTLQLPVTPDVPVTPGTVVTWAKITVGGQVYFTPLYQ